MSKLEKSNNKLILKPEIKLETKVIEIQKDYVVLGCSIVAIYNDGFQEVLETFYQTITKKDFEDLNLKKNERELCLPCLIESIYYEPSIKTYFNKRIFPYKTIDFLFSQPTRGPNLN